MEILDKILDALLDASIDTLKVFVIIFILYFAISFIEATIANKLSKYSKSSPIIGASVGLIPQCGFSVVASDLYKKKYISLGTLLAVFISCSDEALPIILSHGDKILSIIPLLLIKFLVAVGFGYLIDLLLKGKEEILERHHCDDDKMFIHKGCCHHEIEEDENEPFVKKHLIHPLLHSLKIILYVLIINIIFSVLVAFIGEETIKNFLNANVYVTPLLSAIIGLIPNCASSVIISELYVENGLTFAATISGLICNAGLGLVYLYKDKTAIKKNIIITSILFTIALLVGYITLFIELAI